MTVIWSAFQFINIMIEDKGTCSCQVLLMSDYLYIQIFVTISIIFYEITIQIVRQSTILFMNSLKLS